MHRNFLSHRVTCLLELIEIVQLSVDCLDGLLDIQSHFLLAPRLLRIKFKQKSFHVCVQHFSVVYRRIHEHAALTIGLIHRRCGRNLDLLLLIKQTGEFFILLIFLIRKFSRLFHNNNIRESILNHLESVFFTKILVLQQ